MIKSMADVANMCWKYFYQKLFIDQSSNILVNLERTVEEKTYFACSVQEIFKTFSPSNKYFFGIEF